MRIRLLLSFLLVSLYANAGGWQYFFPMNYEYRQFIEPSLQSDSSHLHTAMQPYLISDLERHFSVDSCLDINLSDKKFYSTWVGKKLRNEHLIDIEKDELKLMIDPLFNFQIGNEKDNANNLYVNTRGFNLQGSYKNKFFFWTGLYENQAKYRSYIDAVIKVDSVAPGQGRTKFNPKFNDFNSSFGGIGYVLNRHFNFTFAHDKNFIGDGYRSLLLSDNSFNYPALKLNMNFWKFNYTVIYAVMQDLKTPDDDNVGFRKKYATFHYLDVNIGKRERLSLGFFDAVVFMSDASRGYEINYMNPIILIRPVENAQDSPDNVLLGANIKWRIYPGYVLYGQLIVDELLLKEVRSGNGWYGNKQGVQGGFKMIEPLHIKNLFLQTEVNVVRPFTYGHRSTLQNYAHYNQPLAHPLGSNFVESISIISYRYKSIYASAKIQIAQTASDTANRNLGNDIYLSYEYNVTPYGNKLLQGTKNNLSNIELKLQYIINPKTNFRIEAGMSQRKFSNKTVSTESTFVWFGLSTLLNNYYFDF